MFSQQDNSLLNLPNVQAQPTSQVMMSESMSVSSNLAPLRNPLKSFTFDVPSLPLLSTNIAQSAASSVTAPSPTGMSPNYNFPQSTPHSDMSPRSPFNSHKQSMTKIAHSSTPSFSSSAPGLEQLDVELLNNATPQELELLVTLLQQQQQQQVAPSVQQTPLASPTGVNVPPIQLAGLQNNLLANPFGLMASPTSAPGDKYKTEVCKLWEKEGVCKFGAGCHFAHGYHELKPSVKHPKYKTQLCRSYSKYGTCQYGARCQFIHQMIPASMGPVPQIPDINQLPTQLPNTQLPNQMPTEEELTRMLQIQQMLTNLEL